MKVPLTPIRFLNRAMDLFGHKEGLICGNRRFTYNQFGERCGRLASALKKSGVLPGDRVALLSFNTHKLLEGYFGVPQARAIVMPLNVRLTPSELGSILSHAEAHTLFYETDFAPMVDYLLKACPGLRPINLDTEYEDFIAQGEAERADIFSYDEESIAELFYTSGSTGQPKGVMLSHRTVYMHAMGVLDCFKQTTDSVDLQTIPLFHANGWGRAHTTTMSGVTQVMVRRFQPAGVCRLIQQERCTDMAMVPTMAGALLAYPELHKFDLSSIRQIHLGGAASPLELVRRMEQVFHCEVLVGYGMTETCPVLTTSRRKSTVAYSDEEDRITHQSRAGWAIHGAEVRVVDAQLNDVPRDMSSVGEVVARGDMIMDGYYRDPEGTAAVMAGGWLHTGDMAVWDSESYIEIVDRKKDIIISGGENISSVEVEKVIGSHPDVAEVAIVSAPDTTWGEIPYAFVLARTGCILTEDGMQEFLGPRVARFKMPRKYEFVTEPLPKGGTGKIMKRQLREALWAGHDKRV